MTHVVVIGAGAVGGSVAFHLARRGVHVTIVNDERPGRSASYASYGWLHARDTTPRSYHRLNRTSQETWRRFGAVRAASYTDADGHVDLTRVAEACVRRVRDLGGEAILENAQLDEVRTAARPVPADGLPVVGFPAAAPNAYLAFTHSGATLAPLLGNLAAIEIDAGVRVDDLAPYRPDRFG